MKGKIIVIMPAWQAIKIFMIVIKATGQSLQRKFLFRMITINAFAPTGSKPLKPGKLNLMQNTPLPAIAMQPEPSTLTASKPHKIFFTGLTNALSTRLYSTGPSVEQLLEKYPHSSGYFGQIPPDWFESIPTEKRERYIKKTFKGFSEASTVLRQAILDLGKTQKDKIELQQLNDLIRQELIFDQIQAGMILKNALVGSHIISQKEEVDLEFLGAGSYGAGFKFTINGKELVLKIYYPQHDKKMKKNPYHGRFIEPNRAMFIKKILGQHNMKASQFTDCYFGNIKYGFMVTKFIPEDALPPENTIDLTSIGVRYGDSKEQRYGTNMRHGNIIDYGGIVITNKAFAKTKTARYVYKKTIDKPSEKNRHKEWDKIFDEAIANKVPNSSDLLIGLVSCIRFLPENKQRNRLVKLALQDNLPQKVIIHTACEISDPVIKPAFHLEPKDKLLLLNAFFKNGSVPAQKQMIEILDTIDPEYKINLLNIMLKHSKQEIKPLIIQKIEDLPEDIKPKARKLAEKYPI